MTAHAERYMTRCGVENGDLAVVTIPTQVANNANRTTTGGGGGGFRGGGGGGGFVRPGD